MLKKQLKILYAIHRNPVDKSVSIKGYKTHLTTNELYQELRKQERAFRVCSREYLEELQSKPIEQNKVNGRQNWKSDILERIAEIDLDQVEISQFDKPNVNYMRKTALNLINLNIERRQKQIDRLMLEINRLEYLKNSEGITYDSVKSFIKDL